MPALDVQAKLAILADAAKYDASCASSGTSKRHSQGRSKGIGSTEGMGICHAYAPDGRCISLLKILLTNSCIFDCAYCINRKSSNVRRARFTVEEVVALTLNFYKRNYIEGLFLSSGIIRSPDYTMEQLVRVARDLRTVHGFRGYIHLKTIPDAAPELIEAAGRWADRLSINIEMPTDAGLSAFAPEKDGARIRGAMGSLRGHIDEAKDATKRFRSAPRYAPAGQSTQMIVGADATRDSDIVATASGLYSRYRLRRVYYSAFSPIPDASSSLPPVRPPLVREHRLYQADWLMRFYGFAATEVQAATDDGWLPLDVDPKTAWALKHRELFPLDVNAAPREALLRVPGLGVRAVDAILKARRWRRLRLEDLARLTRSVDKVRAFLIADGWRPTALSDRLDLRGRLAVPARQLDLFAA
ncbi:MAG: putative DNA modification/repair radical SAM protein [Alphaproteobacteria bacterium]|nr:putative DNA modification/repair radical SAM protein [Alphaproteobacteria bacterium]